jgi:hypothetical protein
MKDIVIAVLAIILTTAVFGIAVPAQTAKPKAAALPTGIAGWSGEDSDKLLKDAVIKTRLKKMLGAKNYVSFMDSFETLTPITKDGDVLFASGCLIHACTHLESAIAVNLKNNTIHAAIYNEEKPTRYFNERGGKTPAPIAAWAKRLRELKTPASSETDKQ